MTEPLTRTMSSQLTVRLRDRILSGSYPPGSSLLQDSIAAEFGVSKIPVREALVQLQGEGLVDIFAHRGFKVRPLAASELAELFRIRLQLEPAAVGEGARGATEAEHAAAREAMKRFNEALSAKRWDEVGTLNHEFHLALVVPRVQPLTADILNRVHILSERYVRIHLYPRGRPRRAVQEHGALLAAWQNGKAKEASRITQKHIEEIRDELAEYLASEG